MLELCRGKSIYRVDQPGVLYIVRNDPGCSKRVLKTYTRATMGEEGVPWIPTEEDMSSVCWGVR